VLGSLLLGFWLQAPACADGADLFRKGDLAGARVAVTRALAKGSTAYCEKVMGVIDSAAEEYRLAEPHFRKACELDAKEIDACYFWSRTLYSLDRFEESLEALEKSWGATLEWKIRTGRGQALDALGRAEAEDELRKGIAARKKDARPAGEVDPLLALGSFLYRQGRTREALELLRRAESEYARLAPYQYQLGRALLGEGDWKEAIPALEEAVRLRPGYREAHGLLSRAYFLQGQTALGEVHAQKARNP
jgi:tetratricopeptide (TPR) repeat protein